jgi:hypothetical protein
VSAKAFNARYKPNQTDLVKGLKGDKEVYINGAYYALNEKIYGKWLANYFKVRVGPK